MLFRSSVIEAGHLTFIEKPLFSFLARFSARFSIKVLSGFFFPCFLASFPLLMFITPSYGFDGPSVKPRATGRYMPLIRLQQRYLVQQCLDFLPLPHRHCSLRPAFLSTIVGCCGFNSLFRSPISSALPGSMVMRYFQPCFSNVALTSLNRGN